MEKRIAVVDKEKCDPSRCAKECIKYDPINRSGGEGFHLGEDNKAHIADEITTDVHAICAKKCPFEAIKIIRLPQEASGKPIHQYGPNGFRLYNLPIPMFGKVVGMLGRNGIGKSTAVKILSGLEKPNLGDYTKQDTKDYLTEIIAHFKGTVAQKYFEQMRDGEIVVSYKPQPIHLIPQQFKGTVIELLHKVTQQKEKIQSIAQKVEIDTLLTHAIETLSGGELQRVAIAAAILKEANVYIFDEPSSFLDIKQRIKIAQVIRELANENTAVMVIEHDLIILDYMADLIHITYGQQAAYGIISKAKTTKIGINMYLEGYLRDENIQFRSNKIEFYERVQKDELQLMQLTKWPFMSKKQGTFHLDVKEGEINRHDVIGILGENGIGKTTFAKVLAGVEKPTTGEFKESVKISYKPQHIETNSDELVMNVLAHAKEKFEHNLIKPLGLDKLELQKLSELSGGQLQSVMICYCLSQQADLYLMDEPSAYLDTEQRLLVSKIIKDFMMDSGKSALIIDHDLLFIDYLSDKIIVFEGVPSKSGKVTGPFKMQEGMNAFLKDMNLTFRRDEETHRPRANKPGSQMDQKQIKEEKLYYI